MATAAELDNQNLERIFGKLVHLKTQVICTALDLSVITNVLPSNEIYNMFHVEHGKVLEIK